VQAGCLRIGFDASNQGLAFVIRKQAIDKVPHSIAKLLAVIHLADIPVQDSESTSGKSPCPRLLPLTYSQLRPQLAPPANGSVPAASASLPFRSARRASRQSPHR